MQPKACKEWSNRLKLKDQSSNREGQLLAKGMQEKLIKKIISNPTHFQIIMHVVNREGWNTTMFNIQQLWMQQRGCVHLIIKTEKGIKIRDKKQIKQLKQEAKSTIKQLKQEEKSRARHFTDDLISHLHFNGYIFFTDFRK